MSDFQIGDRVSFMNLTPGTSKGTVMAVHGDFLWVLVDHNTEPRTYPSERWVKVPSFPELWINVFDDSGTAPFTSRARADEYGNVFGTTRVGVIHLASDGTLTMEPA